MELKNIVGVWRLASTRATDPQGKPAGQPFGPRGMGLVTFTSDGRMMSVLVDGRASLPDGTPRQYSSYCGNYTFDGSTLTTVVDANCDPVRFTAPQVRKVRFEGERMVLTPPASEAPLLAASMAPGPPPVMTAKPASARPRPTSTPLA